VPSTALLGTGAHSAAAAPKHPGARAWQGRWQRVVPGPALPRARGRTGAGDDAAAVRRRGQVQHALRVPAQRGHALQPGVPPHVDRVGRVACAHARGGRDPSSHRTRRRPHPGRAVRTPGQSTRPRSCTHPYAGSLRPLPVANAYSRARAGRSPAGRRDQAGRCSGAPGRHRGRRRARWRWRSMPARSPGCPCPPRRPARRWWCSRTCAPLDDRVRATWMVGLDDLAPGPPAVLCPCCPGLHVHMASTAAAWCGRARIASIHFRLSSIR